MTPSRALLAALVAAPAASPYPPARRAPAATRAIVALMPAASVTEARKLGPQRGGRLVAEAIGPA